VPRNFPFDWHKRRLDCLGLNLRASAIFSGAKIAGIMISPCRSLIHLYEPSYFPACQNMDNKLFIYQSILM